LVFKHKIARMIYVFCGWLLLWISLILFIFGMFGLILEIR
jgi:hypothetical protein